MRFIFALYLLAFMCGGGIIRAQAPAGNGGNAWPTVIQDLRQGQSPTLLEDGSRLMTRAAYDLLLDCEVGGGEEYYNKYLITPTWPKEKSGVTIGVGYDLGYVTREVFISDWSPFLAAPQLQQLASCIGMTGAAAQHRIPQLASIRIPWECSRIVFITRTLPRCYQETMAAFPGFEALPPDAQGAIVSLVLNRGASVEGSTREEMAEIRNYVKAGDLAGIASALRRMKHLWAGHGVDGLLRRRDDEATLVEHAGAGYHVASYIALPPLDGTTTALNQPSSLPPAYPPMEAEQLPTSESIQPPAVFAQPTAPAPAPASPELVSCVDILQNLRDPNTRQQVQAEENTVLNTVDQENHVKLDALLLLKEINDQANAQHQRRLVRLYTSVPEDVAWLQQNRHLLVPDSLQGNNVTIDLSGVTDLTGCPPTMEKRLLAIARLAIVRQTNSPTWSTEVVPFDKPAPDLAQSR